MTRPTFSASISLGNVLTVIAMMAAGVAALTVVQWHDEGNQEGIDARTATVQDHSSRLRTSELEAARSEERLASIHNLLARIDARLERIEKRD